VREIFTGNFGLFEPTPNRRSSQPLAASADLHDGDCRYFNFAGRIVARAMIEGIPIQAHLTTAFLKQILGRPPSLRDVEESDPVVYKSLVWFQEHPITDDDELFFSAGVDEITNRDIELKPNGAQIRVTEENKAEFVARMVQNLLHDRFADQITAFCQGFYSLIPLEEIKFFTPSELDLVICGVPEMSTDDFRENCEFMPPYHSGHPVIQRFFNVLSRWDMEKRGKLLFFMTGSSQVPLGGFKMLKDARVPLTVQPGGPRDRLAAAHTCSNILDLPEYETEEEMEGKLLLSIYECASFEFA
jgi:E3 ubiquitin-protein ligase HUWE1